MPSLNEMNKTMENNDVVLIDGMNMFHRQYYAFNKYEFGTAYGFLNVLMKFSKDLSTNKFIVCWDGDKNWRADADSTYKETRKVQRKQYTEEEKIQFHKSLKATKELLMNLGIIQVLDEKYEADDLIAWFTNWFEKDVIIVSNDKDFLQLVNNKKNIKVLKPSGKGEYRVLDEKGVKKEFGVEPKDVTKFLAIAGDTSDNVKGVYKFGRVKALKLINEGMIVKSKLKEVFNKEQLQQFIESYKMVKLGNDDIHEINVGVKNLILLNSPDRMKSKNVYLSRVQEVLSEFQIKKYRAFETKTLFNLDFINDVKNKIEIGEF
jgi:DNA polymerase I